MMIIIIIWKADWIIFSIADLSIIIEEEAECIRSACRLCTYRTIGQFFRVRDNSLGLTKIGGPKTRASSFAPHFQKAYIKINT